MVILVRGRGMGTDSEGGGKMGEGHGGRVVGKQGTRSLMGHSSC